MISLPIVSAICQINPPRCTIVGCVLPPLPPARSFRATIQMLRRTGPFALFKVVFVHKHSETSAGTTNHNLSALRTPSAVDPIQSSPCVLLSCTHILIHFEWKKKAENTWSIRVQPQQLCVQQLSTARYRIWICILYDRYDITRAAAEVELPLGLMTTELKVKLQLYAESD
ncbi:hypothetical protein B0H13DRAFT_1869934 [Mycena leptocephala]|nr:hypothetical protein B0H13DRAFT_1869934 [Mycena leptocephala]